MRYIDWMGTLCKLRTGWSRTPCRQREHGLMGFLVDVSPRWPHRLQRTNRTTPRAPKAPMYPSAETTISSNTTRTATRTSNDTIFHLPLSPHDCIVLRFPSARQVPIRYPTTSNSANFQGPRLRHGSTPATPTSLRDLDWLPARLARLMARQCCRTGVTSQSVAV